MKYFLCALLGLGTLGLDQWVKGWTVSHFAAPAPDVLYATADPAKALIPGVVELTRVHNYGAAWSSFSGMRWLLIAVTSLIVLAVACTLGGHALMTYLLGFVSADVVSFALLAEPIGAAVWALLLFHEKVTPPLMIGGLTVIVGLMLYTYGEMKAGKR